MTGFEPIHDDPGTNPGKLPHPAGKRKDVVKQELANLPNDHRRAELNEHNCDVGVQESKTRGTGANDDDGEVGLFTFLRNERK